jgi:hypothetical protein
MNEKNRDGSLEWPQSGSNVQCEDSANSSCKEQKMTNINTDNRKTALEKMTMTFEQSCLKSNSAALLSETSEEITEEKEVL